MGTDRARQSPELGYPFDWRNPYLLKMGHVLPPLRSGRFFGAIHAKPNHFNIARCQKTSLPGLKVHGVNPPCTTTCGGNASQVDTPVREIGVPGKMCQPGDWRARGKANQRFAGPDGPMAHPTGGTPSGNRPGTPISRLAPQPQPPRPAYFPRGGRRTRLIAERWTCPILLLEEVAKPNVRGLSS